MRVAFTEEFACELPTVGGRTKGEVPIRSRAARRATATTGDDKRCNQCGYRCDLAHGANLPAVAVRCLRLLRRLRPIATAHEPGCSDHRRENQHERCTGQDEQPHGEVTDGDDDRSKPSETDRAVAAGVLIVTHG